MAERKTQRDNMSLVLLAETQVGYQNLVKLVSIAHLEGMYYRPRIDKELLRAHAEGLIGLSGNLRGEVNEACREQRQMMLRRSPGNIRRFSVKIIFF